MLILIHFHSKSYTCMYSRLVVGGVVVVGLVVIGVVAGAVVVDAKNIRYLHYTVD